MAFETLEMKMSFIQMLAAAKELYVANHWFSAVWVCWARNRWNKFDHIRIGLSPFILAICWDEVNKPPVSL
jgi:hypothetical protein